MKKTLLVAGVSALFSLNTLANDQKPLTKEEINQRNKAILAKSGISIPEYNEINIVSASTYIDSKDIKQSANDAHMAKKLKNIWL